MLDGLDGLIKHFLAQFIINVTYAKERHGEGVLTWGGYLING